jgi:dTMP kinase
MGKTRAMTNQKMPFITFEGGEGSGKSTQVEILYKRLLQGEIDVVSYREPGGTKGAEEIRELLLTGDGERWTPTTEALLMSAARAELVQRRIVPQLRAGTWVLCDRFTDSTLAYQGYGHGLGYEAMEDLNRFTVGALEPDLTFIFQLSPELGLERVSLREGVHDRFEQFHPGFHQRVAEGYGEILKRCPNRCFAINALLDIDMISELIFKEVSRRFGLE